MWKTYGNPVWNIYYSFNSLSIKKILAAAALNWSAMKYM